MNQPRLGGGISVVTWLRQNAKIARSKQANTRAEEAERIADWLEGMKIGV